MSIPDPVRHTSERLLEFDHLRDLLAAYTASPLGKGRIASLVPSGNRQWIERQQQLAEELRAYMQCGGGFDFHGLHDPTLLIQKARIQGAALELHEIRDVLYLADRAAEWREAALHPPAAIAAKWEAVLEVSAEILDFPPLLRYFGNKILPDGTLDDRPSTELARPPR